MMNKSYDTEVLHGKSWKEFRETGLLTFVNSFLHIFGWAICLDIDDGNIIDVFPARTAYKGFSEDVMDNAYKNISNYMYDYGSKARYEASHGVLDEEEL